MLSKEARSTGCAIWGVNGKMGRHLVSAIEESADFAVTFGVDRTPNKYANTFPVWTIADDSAPPVDLLIDFSHPDNLADLLSFAVSHKVPALIATTGLTHMHQQIIEEAGLKIPILVTANTSLGISSVAAVLRELCNLLGNSFDVEIIEKHHRHKIDAPSGTARLFAGVITDALGQDMRQIHGREGRLGPRPQAQIGMHAVRGGGIYGEHTVMFAGEHEVIEIRHTALSRELFAHGALSLGRRLTGMPPGVYANEDLWQTNYEGVSTWRK
ncbi:MAG TPA: 4-hydroxy-tetrahydrodipicolinate reductase [Bacillota bacterium]|nr:4-hydroxy-tetrahydrodipicolinate reductase [Bacillota bacterium]